MVSVLIVDDMAIFREPIEALLRAEGFSTRVAANGTDAIVLVGESRPDVIILDLYMPGLSGLDFLKHLRENVETASIPVIVLTAQDDASQNRAVRDLNVEAFLLKTQFSAKELVHRVRQVARRKVETELASSAPAAPFDSAQRTTRPELPHLRPDRLSYSGPQSLTPLLQLDIRA